MRLIIKASEPEKSLPGLQFRRVRSEWDVTNVPDWRRATEFIRRELRRLARSKNDIDSVYIESRRPGVMEVAYDPGQLLIEAVEKSIYSAIVNACIHPSRLD